MKSPMEILNRIKADDIYCKIFKRTEAFYAELFCEGAQFFELQRPFDPSIMVLLQKIIGGGAIWRL